jgi:hypothetical protein
MDSRVTADMVIPARLPPTMMDFVAVRALAETCIERREWGCDASQASLTSANLFSLSPSLLR